MPCTCTSNKVLCVFQSLCCLLWCRFAQGCRMRSELLQLLLVGMHIPRAYVMAVWLLVLTTYVCDLLVGDGCGDLLNLQPQSRPVSISPKVPPAVGPCYCSALTLSHAAAHSPLVPDAHFSSASLMAVSTAALSCMQRGTQTGSR